MALGLFKAKVLISEPGRSVFNSMIGLSERLDWLSVQPDREEAITAIVDIRTGMLLDIELIINGFP
jgi:hypothetical protein